MSKSAINILRVCAVCALISASSAVFAQEELYEVGASPATNPTQSQNASKYKSDIGYLDALILGLVEGVTEYLPVSSTGHLILANYFLKLDGDTPLLDASGTPVLDEQMRPYTMKAIADSYAIVIQFGAILAVAILYWRQLITMLLGLFGRNPAGLKLLRNITVAFLPAAVVGLLLHDMIEQYLFGVKPVIIALSCGALLMLVIQKFYDNAHAYQRRFPSLEDMTIRQSLLIGILQCVAMWPGTSRSMMTILGGYLAGLKPADSARFSFLLGLATLSAASGFKVWKDGAAMFSTISVGPLLLGLVVAFISAALSVHWMVGFLTRRGLAPFAYYRFLLAAALGILLLLKLI